VTRAQALRDNDIKRLADGLVGVETKNPRRAWIPETDDAFTVASNDRMFRTNLKNISRLSPDRATEPLTAPALALLVVGRGQNQ
jgi:hypothetical protein